MMDSLIHFSIKNKLVIGILTLFLIIWGGYSFTQLPIDAVPDITNNQVQVITSSPSLAAQEVERLITFPIEVSLRNIPDIIEIRSISRFGLSVITVVFKDETNVYWARQQVKERLSVAAEQIPKGVGTPDLAPVTTGLGEIYQYTLRPKKGYEKKYSAMDLRSIQDWIVRRQLLGTEGVAEVSSFGGFVKQYEIALDPDKLRNLNISISEIFTALENNNQNTGGAYLDKQPQAYFIRSEGLIGNLDDIGKIVVRHNKQGLPVQIRDVAKVSFGHAIRYGAMTYNGEGEVVGAIVMMLKGENSSKVIRNVKDRIEQIKKSLPEGVEIEAFLDRTGLVNKAVGTVAENLILGALIVIFVLVLLLGNLRAGLVVASVIPLAMLFAVSLMNLFGVSGNLMSLGAIDFGLIVDGAVIIVEATLHHIQLKFKNTQEQSYLSQQEMDDEVFESASKIRSSAAFGEIIILIVYLPLLALVGVEGKMFRPMAQVVSFAILGAFILSLTYVPMASALFLSRKKLYKKSFSDKLLAKLYQFYKPLLAFSLKRSFIILSITVVFFVASLFLFNTLGGEFIPALDEGDFAVDTRTLTGSSLSETIDATLKAEKILKEKFPDEVIKVVGKIGNSEVPTDPMPIEAADMMVILKDKSEWKKTNSTSELAQLMADALIDLPGVSAGFQQPIQMRFNELMTGNKQDVSIKIFGEDLSLLSENAKKVAAVIKNTEGVKDLYVEQVEGLPQVVVSYNRDKLAAFGISVAEANKAINTAFAGSSAGLVFEGEKRFDLTVRLDPAKRSSIDDIQNLFITSPDGMQVPLSQLAAIEVKTGVNQIQREDAKRRITIAFNVRGRDVESVVNEVRAKIEKHIKLPAGYYATYGGQFENLQEAKTRLSIAVPAALFLIFILLYFTFQSVKQSLLIFTAVPLSAIGGIIALWMRGMPFSISAGVGFIALFGVAVLNGIVLIAEFNHLRKSGLSDINTIITEGTYTRFRPVLMTALVASLGFLPMALSNGAGAEVQKPLATVVIGGLLSSTLLTLLVLPVLYMLLEKRADKNDETTLTSTEDSSELTVSDSKSNILFSAVLPKWLIIPRSIIGGVTGFMLLFSGISTKAQVVTLQKALELASSQNLTVKTGLYEIDYQKKLQHTAIDLSKTNLSWTAGQYNSQNFDNNFTVSQSLPFPSVFRKRADLFAAQTKSAENRLVLTKAQLTKEVKLNYYELVYLYNYHKLVNEQMAIFGEFVRAAKVNLKAGSANQLEVATAESQYADTKMLLLQIESDFKAVQAQFKVLLNISENIIPADTTNLKRGLSFSQTDSSKLSQHPLYQYYTQQLLVSQKLKSTEKANFSPDITIGYFNQSLIGFQNINNQDVYFNGSKRFQGFQAGISIPLFYQAQKARVEAAGLQEKIAQNQLTETKKQLQIRYEQALQKYLTSQTTLGFYEEKNLNQAEVLLKTATKAYHSGEIGYVEYSQSLNRALNIRTMYLDLIRAYNQAVIEIEYLISE
jgi:cobalt-zinc-cadmium resistance protein CzcA